MYFGWHVPDTSHDLDPSAPNHKMHTRVTAFLHWPLAGSYILQTCAMYAQSFLHGAMQQAVLF